MGRTMLGLYGGPVALRRSETCRTYQYTIAGRLMDPSMEIFPGVRLGIIQVFDTIKASNQMCYVVIFCLNSNWHNAVDNHTFLFMDNGEGSNESADMKSFICEFAGSVNLAAGKKVIAVTSEWISIQRFSYL